MNSVFRIHARLLNAIGVAAVTLLSACGGGSGPLAGISGTGITSSGTVTALGSVTVNGVTFDTSDAAIIVDGEPATQADLSVGQSVVVTGTLQDETRGVAARVVSDRLLDGPIESIDRENRIITALGQTVRVSSDTVFVDLSFGDLDPLNLILVNGFVDENGDMVATLVRRGAIDFQFGTLTDVNGTVRNLSETSFDINGLTVDYSAVMPDESAGQLRNGALVEVFGTQTERGGVFTASSVEVLDTRLAQPGERVELEGIITDFNSAGDFSIGNQRVDASLVSDTSGLALGIRLEVEGEIAGNGVLVAENLVIRPPSNIRFATAVDAASMGKDQINVFGVRLKIVPTTQFQDASTANTQGMNSLRFSDYVQIDAYRNAHGELVATAITRTDFQTKAAVRGPVATSGCNSTTNTLTIAGILVRLDAADLVAADGSRLGATEFCSLIRPGDLLEANGFENGNELIAKKVSFEN